MPGTQSTEIKKLLPTLLYKGTLKGDNIENIVPMEIKGFVGNIVHATVSQDSKILVFSGKETGKNNYDLFWAVRTSDSVWDNMQAFDNSINTIGNEVFPTLQKNGWLYFSSDGLPGLGALDIYKMPFYLNNTVNSSAKPEHLSYPLNSAFDDYGVSVYSSDKNLIKGFLSTNRFGSDDIYEFAEKPAYIILSSGVVKGIIQGEEEKLLEGATVKLYKLDENGNRIKLDSVNNTNNNGSYKFLIKPNINYQVVAEKEGWQNGTGSTHNISTVQKNKSEEFSIPALFLSKVIEKIKEKEEKKEPEVLPLPNHYAKVLNDTETDKLKEKFVKEFTVHHYFDRTEIIKTDKPIIDSIVNWTKMHKDASILFLVSATDCYGSVVYNTSLSKRRAQHIMSVIKSCGVNPGIIKIKWVGKEQLIEDVGCPENKTKEQQQPNRYTKIIISYK